MKKFKLITSIISLILSLCLVINLCFAWFLTNKNSKANTTVDVLDKVEVIEDVSFYAVSSNENSVITLNSLLGEGSLNWDMSLYSILDDTITTTIMAFKIKSNINTLDITFKTTLTDAIYKNLINYVSSDSSSGIQSEDNSLSSILKVGLINATSVSQNTITYNLLSYSNFVNKDTFSVSNIEYKNIDVVDNYVFISIDYDTFLIEYLYNKNLGNTNIATSVNYVSYKTDFSVEVKGGE